MTDWSFVWTPEFVIGTVVSGLLLNVVGVFVVRVIDRFSTRLGAVFRAESEREARRVEDLKTAAVSDTAMFAALTAEAARLRGQQLLRFFFAFVCLCGFVFLVLSGELPQQSWSWRAAFVIVILTLFGMVAYMRGLELATRIRRLEKALRFANKERNLPGLE